MRKIIKRMLLGLCLLLVTAGIGLLTSTSNVTAQTDTSTETFSCPIYFEFENDSSQRILAQTISIDLDTSYIHGITYQNLLKAIGSQHYRNGKTVYDTLNTYFDYANHVISDDEALAKINAIFEVDNKVDLSTLNSNTQQYIAIFPNTSLDITQTQAEAQKLVSPQWSADDQKYQLPAFNIYLKSNNYQMTIKYVLPNGAPAHADRVVTGYAGKTPATITSPVASNGDVPNQAAVTVNFAKAGNYETVVHYRKPGTTITPAQPTIPDKTSLTATHQATITLGTPVTAATFNARATDAAGQTIPVTVDLSQVKQNRPGTYTVTLKAANGKSLTATLTINPAEAAVSATRFQPFKVYALKTLYLYQHPTFNRHQRLVKYPKAKRTQRPLFVVTGEAHSKAGRLRYRVKDANAKHKTAGKTGYITAKKAFIAPAYYQQAAKQIKVINQSGINVYTDLGLTQKVKHVRTGRILKVTGIQHHHLTTRFVLANGQYATANKKWVLVTK